MVVFLSLREGLHLGGRPRDVDARLQAARHHEGPTHAVCRIGVDREGRPHVDLAQGADLDGGGEHADHEAGLAVEPKGAAHHRGIGAELARPESMAQQGHARSARAVVGGLDHPAQGGLEAPFREEAGRGRRTRGRAGGRPRP